MQSTQRAKREESPETVADSKDAPAESPAFPPWSPTPDQHFAVGAEGKQTNWLRRPVSGIILAAAMTITATLLRQLLGVLGYQPPFITYYPAIMVVALLAGQWSGILTTLLSALCADYFFLPPFGTLAIHSPAAVIGLFLFIAFGVAVSILAETLHTKEEMLRAFFDLSPTPMAVIDSNFVYKRVNQAMASSIHNRRLSEYRGKTIYEVVPVLAQKFEPILKQVLRTGQPIAGVAFSGESAAKPGVVRHWQSYCFPVRRSGHQVHELGAVVIESTAMRNLQDALRNSEARLKDAQRLAEVGSWRWDLASEDVIWSDELFRIFGLAPAPHALPFRLQKALFTPESWLRLSEAVDRALREGTAYEIEVQIVHSSKTARWAIARGQGEFSSNGVLVALHGTLQDITQQKSSEKLKISLAEKEVMLKEIHHRVKNNLQIVSSLLRMQQDHIPELRAKEMFRESENRVLVMAAIHEHLYQSDDFSHVDLTEYLRGIVQTVAASFGQPGIVPIFADAPSVTVDMTAAVPCGLFVNELISNAYKHAFPEGTGTITITVKRLRPGVKIVIEDDGVGLSEPFETIGRNSLGLQLVQTLVQYQLEGELTVSSDKGTRFDIEFKDPM